jgi:uncharacterized membrane protein YtjA (UPF0391 family)
MAARFARHVPRQSCRQGRVAFGPVESLSAQAIPLWSHNAGVSHTNSVARDLLIPESHLEELVMLYWAAVFFVIALLAAVFGFGGIAASAAGAAKILFVVFLILAVVSLIFGRRVPT